MAVKQRSLLAADGARMDIDYINQQDRLCRQTIDELEKTIMFLAMCMQRMVERRAYLHAERKKLKQQDKS